MEEKLVEFIRLMDNMFYGLTKLETRRLAYEFADRNNIQHQFNTATKLAGEKWLKKFCKDNKFSVRSPEKCSLARASGFNKVQVDRFFNNLEELENKYKFPSKRVFNMDESGICTVVNKLPKVISPTGKRCVSKIVSAERGQLVTVVCCMSASGNFVPPAMIFPRQKMNPDLYRGAPEGTLPLYSESGYMNADLFLRWLQHFKDDTLPSKEHPVLLVLDNHVSHCTIEAIKFCRENYIHLLGLPPHTSHKLQPLDRTFFFPLKSAYADESNKWLSNNPGRVITQSLVAELFRKAYYRVCGPEKGVKGFECTGIKPRNRDVFTAEDFLPSTVTDQPQVAVESSPHSPANIEPVAVTIHKTPQHIEPIIEANQIASNSKPIAEIAVTVDETPQNIEPIIKPNQIAQNLKPTEEIISLRHIHAIPKAQPKVRKRKCGKSEILTSSPIKEVKELEKAQKKIKECEAELRKLKKVIKEQEGEKSKQKPKPKLTKDTNKEEKENAPKKTFKQKLAQKLNERKKLQLKQNTATENL